MTTAVRTSETSVNFNLTAWRYMPEDSKLHTHRRENLKSHEVDYVRTCPVCHRNASNFCSISPQIVLVGSERRRNICGRLNTKSLINRFDDKPFSTQEIIFIALIPMLWPNVVMEWLTPLICIRDIPGSNHGPETGYPDRVFVVFLEPSRQMRHSTLKLGHDHFVPNLSQFIIHLSPFHSTP
jgi:hypothetical protein